MPHLIIIIKRDNKSPSAASVGTFRSYPPWPCSLGTRGRAAGGEGILALPYLFSANGVERCRKLNTVVLVDLRV